MAKKKDKFEENACEFKNEQYCEEELDEDGLDVDDAEKKHFEEDEDSYE
jgi:hypothetical protein